MRILARLEFWGQDMPWRTLEMIHEVSDNNTIGTQGARNIAQPSGSNTALLPKRPSNLTHSSGKKKICAGRLGAKLSPPKRDTNTVACSVIYSYLRTYNKHHHNNNNLLFFSFTFFNPL